MFSAYELEFIYLFTYVCMCVCIKYKLQSLTKPGLKAGLVNGTGRQAYLRVIFRRKYPACEEYQPVYQAEGMGNIGGLLSEV